MSFVLFLPSGCKMLAVTGGCSPCTHRADKWQIKIGADEPFPAFFQNPFPAGIWVSFMLLLWYIVVFLGKQMSKIHMFYNLQWCKHDSTFIVLLLRLRVRSLQVLTKYQFLHWRKSWSLYFLGGGGGGEMQLLGSLSFLTLFTPNLNSPVPLPSPLWSVLAHGHGLALLQLGLRVCLLHCGQGGLDWLQAASRQRGAGGRAAALLFGGWEAHLHFSQSTVDFACLCGFCLSVGVEMCWRVKARVDARAAQSSKPNSLGRARNLAKRLALIQEESLQIFVIPYPSLPPKVQKLEGSRKHSGNRFARVLFLYALWFIFLKDIFVVRGNLVFVISKYVHWQCWRVPAGPAQFFFCT